MWQWLAERRRRRQRRRLHERYLALLAAARDLQRNGDIVAFAAKTAEAEAVAQELDALGGEGEPARARPR